MTNELLALGLAAMAYANSNFSIKKDLCRIHFLAKDRQFEINNYN